MYQTTSSSNNITQSVANAKVAIIGAGIAGTYASWLLHKKGISSVIIEKSRGTGGRSSSKRLEDTSCDLGAPYFELTSEQSRISLQEDIEHLKTAKVLAEINISDSTKAYTGVPRMSQLTRYLSGHSELLTGLRAENLIKIKHDDKNKWLITDINYQPIAIAEKIIITAPANQAAQILANSGCQNKLLTTAHKASQSCMPSWAMIIKSKKDLNLSFVTQPNSKIIRRIIKNSDKPQRSNEQHYWVVQAEHKWSEEHLFSEKDSIAQAMLDELCHILNKQTEDTIKHYELEIVHIHRWLLGQYKALNDQHYLWSEKDKIGISADWLCQGDMSGAMLSSYQLIEEIF